MLPDALLGLLLFSAAAGPGYLYVRLSRSRQPRYERAPIEEAAEFVVFGALSSGLALLLALGLAKSSSFLDLAALKDDAIGYTIEEPWRLLAALVAVLSASYGAVWLVTTKLVHRGGATISPGETAWYAAFRRMLPEDHGAYVTVELRDGRAVAGLVVAYTPDSDEPREILLSAPVDGSLWLRDTSGHASALPDAFVIVQGPEILTVSGRYTPEAPAVPPPKT